MVVSTGWDLLERRLPEWPRFLRPGDLDFDQHLVAEYLAAVDSLGAEGAAVAWATSPCVGPERAAGGSVFEQSRIDAQNRVLRDQVAADDRVTLIDLDAVACPGGRFVAAVDDIAIFRPDGVHFSDPGARWVADRIGPVLIALAR